MIPKFRAWDKRSKEMWKVSTLHIEDEYVDLFKKIYMKIRLMIRGLNLEM